MSAFRKSVTPVARVKTYDRVGDVLIESETGLYPLRRADESDIPTEDELRSAGCLYNPKEPREYWVGRVCVEPFIGAYLAYPSLEAAQKAGKCLKTLPGAIGKAKSPANVSVISFPTTKTMKTRLAAKDKKLTDTPDLDGVVGALDMASVENKGVGAPKCDVSAYPLTLGARKASTPLKMRSMGMAETVEDPTMVIGVGGAVNGYGGTVRKDKVTFSLKNGSVSKETQGESADNCTPSVVPKPKKEKAVPKLPERVFRKQLKLLEGLESIGRSHLAQKQRIAYLHMQVREFEIAREEGRVPTYFEAPGFDTPVPPARKATVHAISATVDSNTLQSMVRLWRTQVPKHHPGSGMVREFAPKQLGQFKHLATRLTKYGVVADHVLTVVIANWEAFTKEVSQWVGASKKIQPTYPDIAYLLRYENEAHRFYLQCKGESVLVDKEPSKVLAKVNKANKEISKDSPRGISVEPLQNQGENTANTLKKTVGLQATGKIEELFTFKDEPYATGEWTPPAK